MYFFTCNHSINNGLFSGVLLAFYVLWRAVAGGIAKNRDLA
jgi:hypothetical protein